MKDFIYTVENSSGKVDLYEIIEGRKTFLKSFNDREDMLLYIETHFNYSNLQVISEYY